MSMAVKEIREWLNSLDDDDEVGVEEGGLILLAEGKPDTYCEIGGMEDGR